MIRLIYKNCACEAALLKFLCLPELSSRMFLGSMGLLVTPDRSAYKTMPTHVTSYTQQHRWCSGIMEDSHSFDPGSIPGRCMLFLN